MISYHQGIFAVLRFRFLLIDTAVNQVILFLTGCFVLLFVLFLMMTFLIGGYDAFSNRRAQPQNEKL